jgi:hypothetical protein
MPGPMPGRQAGKSFILASASFAGEAPAGGTGPLLKSAKPGSNPKAEGRNSKEARSSKAESVPVPRLEGPRISAFGFSGPLPLPPSRTS